MDLPNVREFLDQTETYRELLSTEPPGLDQMKDVDFLMAGGEIFALVVYAQLILENARIYDIDDDLLEGTLEQLAVPFDLLITAAGLRSYKPAPAHFLAAIEACDRRPEAIVHVAESFYHDVMAARPLGIRTLWVNRTAASPLEDVTPSAELRDLAEVADWIEAL